MPTLPQQANLLTKDFPLPTTFRVGLAYDVITGDNNRLTVLGDFNQPNNNTPGFAFGSEWMSNRHRRLQLRVRAPGQLQLHRRQRPRPGRPRDRAQRRGEPAWSRLRRRPHVRRERGFSLGLDYAYKYLGILGPTNFFSFSLGW